MIELFEKNIHTHCVSLIISIHAFLHDNLAMCILVELKVRVNDEENFKKFDNDKNRDVLLALMESCGSKQTSRIHYGYALNECLE